MMLKAFFSFNKVEFSVLFLVPFVHLSGKGLNFFFLNMVMQPFSLEVLFIYIIHVLLYCNYFDLNTADIESRHAAKLLQYRGHPPHRELPGPKC